MTIVGTSGVQSGGSFARGLQVQRRVIVALLLRELHTRFGRDNIGYLWVFGEPMFLATAVGLIHFSGHVSFGQTINPIGLAVLGYSGFMIFRSIVSRSEGMLESNTPLLYHRSVTILDMLVSRAFLDMCAFTVSLIVMMSGCIQLGFAPLPERPLDLIIGLLLLTWFSFNLSMIVCSIAHERPVVARFVHPIMYISMPLSAAFFTLSSLPTSVRDILSWWPLAGIFEQLRYGWFPSASDKYLYSEYVVMMNVVMTYVGLILIRKLRRQVHLH